MSAGCLGRTTAPGIGGRTRARRAPPVVPARRRSVSVRSMASTAGLCRYRPFSHPSMMPFGKPCSSSPSALCSRPIDSRKCLISLPVSRRVLGPHRQDRFALRLLALLDRVLLVAALVAPVHRAIHARGHAAEADRDFFHGQCVVAAAPPVEVAFEGEFRHAVKIAWSATASNLHTRHQATAIRSPPTAL